jgi:glycosyltransferase involved in cell wall biosynthesis
MATVSVIMGGFNAAPYIGAAIESVQSQTFTDWELVVVDDGSTDSTAEIVAAFAAGDARVRLIRQTNKGISAARNRALSEATGAWLALLDSDDLWEPRFLEAQLAIFARHPEVDIVTGNGWFLGGPHHGLPARPWPDTRPAPTLASILADETAIFIMSIMRRRVYTALGGFDEALRTNEDYEFWLRAAARGFVFIRNDEPLGHYRRHRDSLSASDTRMVTGIVRVYEKMHAALADRPDERQIAAAQLHRFQRQQLAVQARDALEAGEAGLAVERLNALYAHGGGTFVRIAGIVARWAPKLVSRAYQLRRGRQEAAS